MMAEDGGAGCVDPADDGDTVFVAIGANLPGPAGDALATCQWAAARLSGLCGLRLAGLSRWYRTRPVPASDQPDYVNGVAQLMGAVDPASLLRALQALEADGGRMRTVANAARSLDLDIAAMGGLVRAAPHPVLPHPRMHERRFVLVPLHDLAPGWRHPVLGRTVAALVAGLPPDPAMRVIDGRVG